MVSNKKIDDFVDEIIKEKDLSNVDQEVISQLKEDLQERLEDRINAVILSKIPEDKLSEFEKLLDAGEEEAMQAFLAQTVPNLDAVISLELLNFRKMYLG